MRKGYRIVEILKYRGARHLSNVLYGRFRTGIVNKMNRFPFINNKTAYYESRIDNQSRWSFINSHLTSNNSILVDIGCAEGYFATKAARSGYLSLGIDGSPEMISYAQSEMEFEENLGFAGWKMNPENIKDLPQSDVVLLLTVYHHFVHHYGFEDAKKMFRTIASKTKKIIFEPPGDRWLNLSLDVTARNKSNNEEVQFTLEPEPNQCRPQLGHRLSPGEYVIEIGAKDYETSKRKNITIGKSGLVLGERARIRVVNGNIEIVSGQNDDLEIPDMIDWYTRQIKDIFGESVIIKDVKTTNYKGKKRRDPIFVLDVKEYTMTD